MSVKESDTPGKAGGLMSGAASKAVIPYDYSFALFADLTMG